MASNVNRPQGLRPVQYLDGAKYDGKVNMYLIPSTDGTATFIGDPVALAGAAAAAGTVVNGQDMEGMPTIKQAAAGSTPVGVVVGFLPNQSDLTQLYRTASTNRIALVCDSPDVIFEVQEDGVGSTLKAADVGENADLILGSGSTTTGISTAMVDSSTHATTSATVRVLGLVKRPDNGMGSGGTAATDLYAKWLVMFNEHEYKSTSGA